MLISTPGVTIATLVDTGLCADVECSIDISQVACIAFSVCIGISGYQHLLCELDWMLIVSQLRIMA